MIKTIALTFISTAILPFLVYLYFYYSGGQEYLSELLAVQSGYAASVDPPTLRTLYMMWSNLEFFPVLFLCAFLLPVLLFAKRSIAVFVSIWLYLAMAIYLGQGKYIQYHFLPAVLPLSVVGALSLSAIRSYAKEKLSHSQQSPALLIIYSLPLYMIVSNLSYFVVPIKYVSGGISAERYFRLFSYWTHSYPRTQRLAEVVSRYSDPDEKIFVFSFEPNIYLLSKRRSVSRFFTNQVIGQGWYPIWFRRSAFVEMHADVRRSKPQVIVADFYIGDSLRPLLSADRSYFKFGDLRYNVVYREAAFFVGVRDSDGTAGRL